ncbi:MAG: M20/M25/M40 family metallo-hydrolase [Bacteroidales bacterium]|nr:M20/M25/M40 family metallo-hydrolase [Bacteroidales bacterium]MCF8390969.1 M20/M25/M40 family metallo-hydrolase [Bacteroidales bacterium]
MNTAYYNQALNLLRQLISIPSLSGEEGFLADFLSKWLREKGFSVKRIHNNIWSESIISPDLPTILLNSHMDTVKAVSGWSRDPFIPEETDEFIYGLGASDAGASLVSLLMAFIALSKIENRAYNLIMLISAEEENSGPHGISSAIEKIGKIDLAVVGEPTEMQLAICERGLMVLDCIAKGTAAHVAHKNGDNAILKAMRDIDILYGLKFKKTSKLLGDVQLEVTQIEAGYQHNIVPDVCKFVVDVRTNENYTNKKALQIIQESVKSEVVPRSLRLKASFIDPEHSLVKKAKKMGLHTFGSKTMSDQALIPAPSVKIGPGKSSLSHKADEHIEKLQIKQCIDLYINLLKDYKI